MASSMARLARVCAGCGQAEPEGITFYACALCVEMKLSSTLYCSPVCQKNHWPKHKVWHKQQKKFAKDTVEEVEAANVRLCGTFFRQYIDPLSLPSEPTKLLTLKQLGLKSGLPQNPVPDLRFLTFQSWWTE